MKKIILFQIIVGFAAAIIVFSFLSQESISKNIGLEKEHYELSFAGIQTYREGDHVKIKLLLSGYGTDCASSLIEIRDSDGEVIERTGGVIDCTARPMKKLNSVEVFMIESRPEAGKYSVFAQFSANPDEYYTKTENFTVAKIDQTGLSYPIEPTFDQNKFDAVVEGTLRWCIGHKEPPNWTQCEIVVSSYIKFDGQKTDVLTALVDRSVIIPDNEKMLFGLEYHKEQNFFEIKESMVIEK